MKNLIGWNENGALDGRQTRPANHVGRPDGSAERTLVDGGWSIWHAAWKAAQASPRCSCINCETTAFNAWTTARRLIANAEAAAKGKRGRKAPHGSAAKDAP